MRVLVLDRRLRTIYALVFMTSRLLPSALAVFGPPAVGTLGASVGWSILEAIELARESGIGWWHAWSATGFAAALTGVIISVLVAGILAAARSDLGLRIRAKLPPVGWSMSAAWAAVVLAASTYGLSQLLAARFSGSGSRAVGMTFAVAVLAFGLVLACLAAQPRLHQAMSSRWRWRWLFFAILGGVTLLVGTWIVLAEPEVIRDLGLVPMWPALVSFVSGIASGLLVPPGRWTFITALAFALVLLTAAVGYSTTAEPENLHAKIHQYTDGTRLVFGGLQMGVETNVVEFVPTDATSCSPEHAMPSPDSIGQAGKRAPDIILITVDAFRWDRTTMADYWRDTTPDLAARAESGVVFSRAFTPSNSTRQTFRSLFSGLHPSMVLPSKPAKGTGRWGLSFSPEQITMAEFLSAAGYDTVAILGSNYPFDPRNHALKGFQEIDPSPTRSPAHASYQADRIIAALSERQKRPRFVWTHMMETHQPYKVGPHPVKFGEKDPDRYDAALHFLDGELARVVDFVTGPARRDNTVLVIAADHGQAFGEHGHHLHGSSLYGEEVHVPLLVWGPGFEPRRITASVSLLDVFPTFFDLAGLPPIPALCGRSLLPFLRGKKAKSRDVYIEVTPDHMRKHFKVALIKGRHKLIYHPNSGGKELYDLDDDPGEEHDLVESKPKRVERVLRRLLRYYEHHDMDTEPYAIARRG